MDDEPAPAADRTEFLGALSAAEITGLATPMQAWLWCQRLRMGISLGFSAGILAVSLPIALWLLVLGGSSDLSISYGLIALTVPIAGLNGVLVLRRRLPPWRTLQRAWRGDIPGGDPYPPGLVDWSRAQMIDAAAVRAAAVKADNNEPEPRA